MARTKPGLWRGKELPAGYERDLERLVDQAFDEAARRDWTWKDLARFSNLSYPTVWRLGMRITRVPMILTAWKICDAVQINVISEPRRAKVTKKKQTI